MGNVCYPKIVGKLSSLLYVAKVFLKPTSQTRESREKFDERTEWTERNFPITFCHSALGQNGPDEKRFDWNEMRRRKIIGTLCIRCPILLRYSLYIVNYTHVYKTRDTVICTQSGLYRYRRADFRTNVIYVCVSTSVRVRVLST